MKFASTILLFLLFATNVNAQKFGVLTNTEKKDLKELAKNYIQEFDENLREIPKIKNKIIQKKRIKQFLRRFLDSAKVEVAINERVRKKYNAKTYFRNVLVKYGRNVDVIDIQIVSFDVGDFKPVEGEPGMYYLDYTIVQQFRKYDKFKKTPEGLRYVKYGDTTIKKGRFYVKRVYTVAGARWRLYFGSIKVVDYKRL